MKSSLLITLILIASQIHTGKEIYPFANQLEAQFFAPVDYTQSLDPGLVLLQKHCYTCHDPKSKSHDEIKAPPLWGVKKHYLEAYPEQEAFESAMSEFVKEPSEQKAILKGPVKRFGLMPKPVLTQEEISKIVQYIYQEELENPAWHKKMEN